jgi:TIR domain
VALSFAGAQRPYVARVAAALKGRGVRCFYDADEQMRLWGTHLVEEIPRIYTDESAAVVVFVSADYARGDWTRLERRAAFSSAVHDAGVYVLPARFDDSRLPGLVSDVVDVDLRRLDPEEFAELVIAKLADLAGASSALPGRGDLRGARPAGAVRVADALPRRLGVHDAIQIAGVPDDMPPVYVERDVDRSDNGTRARLRAAAVHGGFVLLLGGSSAGKTRCAVEAVTAVLPDWWLIHPAGPADVAAVAERPPGGTVLWLDELQRYLDGESGLTGGMVRALLNADDPVVVVATMWPDRYGTYTALPIPGHDAHAREREVLHLADVIRIDGSFTEAEQARARDASADDRRLRIALNTAGYGLTQTLAAAPALVAHWSDARTAHPYAWAVLTAALDGARLGVTGPLPADLLREAAVDYCTDQQQAEAPDDWFEQALAYATRKLHGATAALRPAGAGMGKIAGYIVADYLVQHATRTRRYERAPASLWAALRDHLTQPDDIRRVCGSAESRRIHAVAVPLLRVLADAGDREAAGRLVDLLFSAGDRDELRARADAGDEWAAIRLVDLLVEGGDRTGAIKVLRAHGDTGHRWPTDPLVDLLVEVGDRAGAIEVLRAHGDTSDGWTTHRLADLLVEVGDRAGAIEVLRARADAGHDRAAFRLAELLAEVGDLDELRARADAGHLRAVYRLAGLLADAGDSDELRARADAGDEWAAVRLAELLLSAGNRAGAIEVLRTGGVWVVVRLADLLVEGGDPTAAIKVLRTRDSAGDEAVAHRLAELLVSAGDQAGAIEVLRACGDAGHGWATRGLANLLVEDGDRAGAIEVLRACDAGDGWATHRLADLLVEDGDRAGAIEVLRAGGGWVAGRLADLLVEDGDRAGAIEALRTRDGAGDEAVAHRLAELLISAGDQAGATEVLRACGDAGHGDGWATVRLAELLISAGDRAGAIEALRADCDAGGGWVAVELADLLVEDGDRAGAIEVLRTRADAGDGEGRATVRLVELLFSAGDHDELRARTDSGYGRAADRLVELLFSAGDHDELRARADAGHGWAAHRLADLLANTGDDRLQRFGFDLDGRIAAGPTW